MNVTEKDFGLYLNIDGKDVRLDADTIDAIHNYHEKTRVLDDLKYQVGDESKVAGFYTDKDYNDIVDFYLKYKENNRSEAEQLSELIESKDDKIREEMFLTVSLDKNYRENDGDVPWAGDEYVIGSGQAYVARDIDGERTKAFAFDVDFAVGEGDDIIILQSAPDVLKEDFGIIVDEEDLENDLLDNICYLMGRDGRSFYDIFDEIKGEKALDDMCESAEGRSDEGKLAASVKEWYIEEYPTDDVGPELSDKATFGDVVNALKNHEDVYEVIGFGDSVVRERVFDELSDRLGTDYNNIYDAWLGTKDLDLGKDVSDDAR